MWELWRVHDVFERARSSTGRRPRRETTALCPTARSPPARRSRPSAAARKPMPPMPGATVQISQGQPQVTGNGNPGSPSSSPPRPGTAHPSTPGHPRRRRPAAHRINDAPSSRPYPLDFHKELLTAQAEQIPEDGTTVEKQAMTFHEQAATRAASRRHMRRELRSPMAGRGRPRAPSPSRATPLGGQPPYHQGGRHRGRRQAQQGRLALPAAALQRPLGGRRRLPRPLGGTKKRARAALLPRQQRQRIDFWLPTWCPRSTARRLPGAHPTDILGQHIHLVKFDVTASDGAANGFNYEDGSFSPAKCRSGPRHPRFQRLLRAHRPRDGTFTCPKARPIFFGAGRTRTATAWPTGSAPRPRSSAGGPIRSRTRGQRPTLRTVFTHDHFGPSTPSRRALRRPGDRARGLDLGPQRDRRPLGGRHDGGPPPGRRSSIRPPSRPTAMSSWSSATSSSPTRLTATPAASTRVPGRDPLRRSRQGDQPSGRRRWASPTCCCAPRMPGSRCGAPCPERSQPTTRAPCPSTTATSRLLCGCATRRPTPRRPDAGDLSFAFARSSQRPRPQRPADLLPGADPGPGRLRPFTRSCAPMRRTGCRSGARGRPRGGHTSASTA